MFALAAESLHSFPVAGLFPDLIMPPPSQIPQPPSVKSGNQTTPPQPRLGHLSQIKQGGSAPSIVERFQTQKFKGFQHKHLPP